MTEEARGKKQTAVYVEGLPDDVTVDELKEHFCKVGVIMDDMFTGGPRIKIYEDEDGNPKGDALIVYLCEPSVRLAIDILDESQLRPGVVIRVSQARQKEQEEGEERKELEGDAEHQAKQRKVDKETWRKQMREMKRKVAWDADEEEGVVEDPVASAADALRRAKENRNAKVVILKHMFTREELESDPKAILDIKEDILLEAERLGKVTNVYLFEDSEDGRCAVKFADREAASKCLAVFDGRYFGGQRIDAELYDGSFRLRERRHAATRPVTSEGEGDLTDEERLDKFAEWLEQDNDDE